MTVPDWLSITGDVSSVVSVIVTAFVWYQTREIRKSVVARIRIPESSQSLKKLADQLVRYMTDWPRSQKEAYVVLSQIEAVLLNLLPKVDGTEKKSAAKLLVLVQNRRSFWRVWIKVDAVRTADKMWAVQAALMGTVEILDQLNKDNKRRA